MYIHINFYERNPEMIYFMDAIQKNGLLYLFYFTCIKICSIVSMKV